MLVTIDYKGSWGSWFQGTLDRTDTDAERMKTTFTNLGYNVVQLQNKKATKSAIENTLQQLSEYLDQYKGQMDKALVFAFSGHGDSKNIIISHDRGRLSVKKDILPYFVSHRNIYDIPKIFFIDACRGSYELTKMAYTIVDKVKGESHKEGNYLIAYATIDGHVSHDGRWMQNLALKIENEVNVPLSKILDDLSRDVRRRQGHDQQPEYVSRLRGSFEFKRLA